ncbi:hypothetical protein HDU87_003594 [Geranomyces variabilis]|uniref:Uncharacterized protein n=1 Tax=Geranomyces variabilis TaxID=109894 RepID=A0AAD5TCX7_9FUNG|nr:hypothetical protein HDU87_003594 [Geranomyces variabilis]
MDVSLSTHGIARRLQMPLMSGLSGEYIIEYVEQLTKAGPRDFVTVSALQEAHPFLPWLKALGEPEIGAWCDRHRNLHLESQVSAARFLREFMKDLEDWGFHVGYAWNKTKKAFSLYGVTLKVAVETQVDDADSEIEERPSEASSEASSEDQPSSDSEADSD